MRAWLKGISDDTFQFFGLDSSQVVESTDKEVLC